MNSEHTCLIVQNILNCIAITRIFHQRNAVTCTPDVVSLCYTSALILGSHEPYHGFFLCFKNLLEWIQVHIPLLAPFLLETVKSTADNHLIETLPIVLARALPIKKMMKPV